MEICKSWLGEIAGLAAPVIFISCVEMPGAGGDPTMLLIGRGILTPTSDLQKWRAHTLCAFCCKGNSLSSVHENFNLAYPSGCINYHSTHNIILLLLLYYNVYNIKKTLRKNMYSHNCSFSNISKVLFNRGKILNRIILNLIL